MNVDSMEKLGADPNENMAGKAATEMSSFGRSLIDVMGKTTKPSRLGIKNDNLGE
ncbi:hypothetical protein D3C87_1421940 [compost metagenome]